MGRWLLLALAVTFAPVGTQTSAAEPGPPLRILTFNLLHDGPLSGFFDNGTHLEARLDMTMQAMKNLDPDVIALQEASQTRVHGNVPEKIARALGMHVVYAPATDRIFGFRALDRFIVWAMGFQEGLAILSRYPILGSEIYDLRRCRHRLEPRILLRADLSTPWGPMSIYSVHTARGDECQLRQVMDIARTHPTAGVSILTGDFNSLETSQVLVAMGREAGFLDVYRAINPHDPGYTVWQRIKVEQPTASRRVDFILLSAGTESSATVRSSRVILDRPGRLPDGSALWPSDHYGVLAEIERTPSGPTEPNP